MSQLTLTERREAQSRILSRQERWRERNPVATWAHRQLQRAVRSGKLARPGVCAHCGANEGPIDAHHADYLAPLRVTWLCRRCHREEHRRLKREGSA